MNQLYYLFIILINIFISAVPIDCKHRAVPIDSLTEETCLKKRVGCCDSPELQDKLVAIKCIATFSVDVTQLDRQDQNFLMKFLTCFVECMYKKSRFIGKNDTLNMKMVKLKAEELFNNRREKEYYIHTHEVCNVQAKERFEKVINSAATKALLKNTCRPFFTFLFDCVNHYHEFNDCPYFRWFANEMSDHAHDCHLARKRCFEIVY